MNQLGSGDTGSENYGGRIVTDGGSLLIGATILHREFRAWQIRRDALFVFEDFDVASR